MKNKKCENWIVKNWKILKYNMKNKKCEKWIVKIGMILSISLFLYCIIYIYTYYSNNNILWYVPDSFKKGMKGENISLSPNEVGDSIGGILSPIVGLLASILTFIAFYIQKIANNEIKDQFKIQQFENQFYEMLRLHKENVNEIEIKTNSGKEIRGRLVFYEMKKELELLLTFIKNYNSKSLLDSDLFIEAYDKFFWGFNNEKKISKKSSSKVDFDDSSSFEAKLINLKEGKEVEDLDIVNLKKNLNIPLLEGYHAYLGHYYRHLFHTVKFIVNKRFLTYEIKLNYLRILRAQLSNYEQIMLFYNWLSKYGRAWENKENHFLTEYKMIHNLWYEELLEDEYVIKKLKKLVKVYKKRLKYSDNLFEMGDNKLQ